MASKSASNRRSPATKNESKRKSNTTSALEQNDEYAIEDSLAYEHVFADSEDAEAGYLSQATHRVRDMTQGREGRIVVAALASGFAIGTAIGWVIAGSRQRQPSWSDRLACEGLGRSLLDRLASVIPESISEKLGR